MRPEVSHDLKDREYEAYVGAASMRFSVRSTGRAPTLARYPRMVLAVDRCLHLE